jgi:Family of unknown function (DUF5362)
MEDNTILDSLNDDSSGKGLSLTNEIKGYLSETARWAKFISIIMFVMTGFAVLFAIFGGAIMGSMASAFGQGGAGMGLIGGVGIFIMYGLVAALLFFYSWYLYKFATQMKMALLGSDQDALVTSFSNLKSYYKLSGIVMLIGVIFYGIFFVIAIITGLGVAAGGF